MSDQKSPDTLDRILKDMYVARDKMAVIANELAVATNEFNQLEAKLKAYVAVARMSAEDALAEAGLNVKETSEDAKTTKLGPRQRIIDYIVSLKGQDVTPREVADKFPDIQVTYVRMILSTNKDPRIESKERGKYHATGFSPRNEVLI